MMEGRFSNNRALLMSVSDSVYTVVGIISFRRLAIIFLHAVFLLAYFEPCHEKTCLLDFGPGRSDTNMAVEQQKIARLLEA